jgi:hypothetical protein
MWSTAALSAPEGDWQLAMVHNPSSGQLKVEERGRVYIYDRLPDTEVELAMNTQFDRLDNMMFVRTTVVTPEGETEVADDDCD